MRTVPRQLPPFALLVDDCGFNTRHIAKYLGVSERTIKKWIRRDHAPRAATLALFFCTRWGREYVNCDAENHANVMRGLASAAEHRAKQAETKAKQAEKKLADFFEQGVLFGISSTLNALPQPSKRKPAYSGLLNEAEKL